ncbi:MAG: hypothetical protein J6Y00_05055 [Paludibacteraceae bacterium]|nr:hypothetical protein [Paludibacteraceae bacterium]
MKKLCFYASVLATMALSFSSCNDNKGGGSDVIDPTNQVSDGMYVIGDAVGVTDMKDAADLLMAAGVNEKLMDVEKKSWTDAHRAGMYEKYLYLEANKDFTLTLLDGEKTTNFGGNLERADLTFDAGSAEGYWCALMEDKSMQVPETGFYHVVLDLDLDKGLEAAGGAQIIVAPVSWGISGDCNGWGMTVGEKEGNTWTWNDVEFHAGQTFKFKDEHGWKIWLDGETQQISAHTNLGANLQNGGDNITVEEGGLYKIVLTYKMAKGDIAASYSYIMERTGDAAELNPADFVVGISGSMQGWSTPEGTSLAKYNADESNVADAKTKAGVYVYNITGLTFPENSTFKFRMDGDWLGFGAVEIVGVNATEAESDQNFTGVVGTYNIKITIEWDGAARKSYKAEFTEGEAVEMVKGMVYVLNETGIEAANLNIYGYGGSELFGGWPGKAYDGTTIKDNYIGFEYEAVKDAEYRFIINDGNGWQTSDMADGIIVTGQEIYLNASAETTLTIIK